MAIFGGCVFVAAWGGLQETGAAGDPHALRPRRLASNFARLLSNRRFLAYLFVPPLLFGGFFSFIAVAPFLYIEQLGLSPGVLGAVFLLHSLAFLIGVQCARPLNRVGGLDRTIFVGTMIGSLAATVMLALALADYFSVAALTGPIMALMLGLGMVIPNATVCAISLHPEMGGMASALQGSTMMGAAAFFTWLIGKLPGPDDTSLAIVVAVSAGLAGLLFLVAVGTGKRSGV